MKSYFPHTPTADQERAIQQLSLFMGHHKCSPHGQSEHTDTAFILRGYAGTGKTALMSALVLACCNAERSVVLLAPTGRAAQRLAEQTGRPASTIHREIFRASSTTDPNASFSLSPNMHSNALFIVDEASMIGNCSRIDTDSAGSSFGTGRLLDDLIHYVYSGKNCRLLLAGDDAQLPPIGETHSKALDREYLEGYGLTVMEATLTQVVRQAKLSGILWNATNIRNHINNNRNAILQNSHNGKSFTDIELLSGSDVVDAISASYAHEGIDNTLIITRSNKAALQYNLGIRRMVLDYDEELCSNERLILCRNSYSGQELFANGDMIVVNRMRREREIYDCRFADITFNKTSAPEKEYDKVFLLDTLTTDYSPHKQSLLYQSLLEDYAHIPRKADRMAALRTDQYYNSLQAKYGYAITCHKAQGGQWKHIYLDIGYVAPEQQTQEFTRWLYTAVTRATDKLYLINYNPT